MSWFSRSLSSLLQDNEAKEEKEVEFWDDPELFDTAKSVKDDLVELKKGLAQSLLGVASFLAPPPISQPEADPDSQEVKDPDAEAVSTSDVSSQKLSGIQNDFAELKGGFAKGLSRLSSVIRGDEVRGEGSDSKEQKTTPTNLNILLKPLIENVLSTESKPELSEEHHDTESKPELWEEHHDTENATTDLESPLSRMGLSATLASHIDGISKLASSLFPIIGDEESEDVLEAYGLTDEVVAFARNISMHPETWLDFPMAADDEQDAGFELNNFQSEHAYAVERAAPRLAALKVELCPRHMSEGRFWKIYFVLLHSRLSQEDAALLSPPQVLEARNLLLQQLKEKEGGGADQKPTQDDEEKAADTGHASAEPDDSMVVDKDAIPSTVKLAPSKSVEEAEADEWLDEDAASTSARGPGASNKAGPGTGNHEDDVSFSDLEDEEDRTQQQTAATAATTENRAQGWVELSKSEEISKRHERVGSNDWLTVDKEDVGSGNS